MAIFKVKVMVKGHNLIDNGVIWKSFMTIHAKYEVSTFKPRLL